LILEKEEEEERKRGRRSPLSYSPEAAMGMKY